eukprot:gene7040-10383_t
MFSAVRRITAMSGGRVRAAFAASTAAAQRAVLSQQRTVFCLKQQRWCGGVGAGQGAAPRTHESLEELDAEYTDKAVEMLDEVGKVINEAWDKEIREPAILFKVIQAMDLYSKAMDRGSARAANDLAVIYHTGRGIPADFELAEECYSRALELVVARQTLAGETPDERNTFLCASYASLLQQLETPRHDDAIQLLQQAHRLDNDDVGIQTSLGDAHVRAAAELVGTDPSKAADHLAEGADHFAVVWGEDNVTSEAIRKDVEMLRAEAEKIL